MQPPQPTGHPSLSKEGNYPNYHLRLPVIASNRIDYSEGTNGEIASSPVITSN